MRREYLSLPEKDRKLFSFAHLCPQAPEATTAADLEESWTLGASGIGNKTANQETVCLNYCEPTSQERSQTQPDSMAVAMCVSASICE